MGAYPTINLNDFLPAAPANGVNVKFQAVQSVHNPLIDNVSAALVGDGNTAHFLRGDGTFATPPSGGSGFPTGANIAPWIPPLSVDEGAGWGGYSLMAKIPASMIGAFTSQFKIVFQSGAGASTKVNKAVLRRTTPGSVTFTDTTTITWGASGSPTFSASTFNTSDAMGLAMDAAHDIYIIVYLDPTQSASAHEMGWSPTAAPFPSLSGYASGDFTATSDTTGLTLTTNQWVGIAQVLTA